MNKLYLPVLMLMSILVVSCSGTKQLTSESKGQDDLGALITAMTGTFSSTEQSQQDSLFYDISLNMHPIWQNDKTAKWLYVEQAVTSNIKKPYRQRVYRVAKTANGEYESRVYTLPTPTVYIHGWEHADIFNQFNSSDLILREGCAVFLKKDKNNCFSGATKEQDCGSTLRGAKYATSIVSICADEIVSWDQGWNDKDAQVWGAETEGYIFKRIK